MIFDYITALALAVVEGVTEFLPISSTGHLIIVNRWLSFGPEFTALFDVVIQLGAILSVVFIFRKKLFSFVRRDGGGSDTNTDSRKLATGNSLAIWKKVIVAVIPALGLGFIFGSFIEEHLFNPFVVAIALIVGGVVLIFAEKYTENRVEKRVEAAISDVANISYRKALAIGFIQCLAMIPGTSRSASTIIGGLFLGASRSVAVEFSFFLAIPTMFAASGYALLKGGLNMSAQELSLLIFGFIMSFVVAFAVVRLFLRYIQTNTFIPFGYYRIILGLLVLAVFYVF